MDTSPKCDHMTAADGACPNCAPAARNGAIPAEVETWVIDPTPPDLLAWARQTFDEAEYLALLREVEQTGGVRFEEFIGEVEARATRRG